MPTYSYTAANQAGKEEKGVIFATTKEEVAKNLKSRNLLVTSIKEKEEFINLEKIRFLNKVPLMEKMLMVRYMATMINAGLSLSASLKILESQTTNTRLKQILAEAHYTVESGQPLSSSLSRYPDTFSDVFISMLKVGEISGNLDKVLIYLASQLEKEHELKSKIRGALAYPVVLLVAAFFIGVLMLIYVVPQITQVFLDMDVDLPLATQIFIGVSDFILRYFWIIMIVLVVLVAALVQFFNTKKGKRVYDKVITRLPYVGSIVKKINLSRFNRTLNNLLRSGVPILESLEVVRGSMTNALYKDSLKNVILKVKKGFNLSSALKDEPKLFPVVNIRMIAVGEKTGETEEMLEKLAAFYDAEIDNFVKNISSVIEPVLMLLIGGVIAFLAFSIIAPIYSIITQF